MQQSGRSADDKGNLQKVGEGLGGLMGQAADVGMGMLGSMMNSMGGWWAQATSQPDVAGSFGDELDGACRSDFETSARGGARSYDEARPLYRFGHLAGQNPDYQGRSFREVEPELERGWGPEQRQRYGDWPEVRGFVDFGYSQGSSGGRPR